ncbi:hypothetical protein KC19_3G163200 [Ceratodon purpureus]|uniref:Uncharacterized protein n=1 Tax=Ceratodon purpureus TaxID=3225 RepID=A0A8T0ILK0_CERPU|nr:hypothetical protein KC19_3G163200 [Ceratodon purpureus]
MLHRIIQRRKKRSKNKFFWDEGFDLWCPCPIQLQKGSQYHLSHLNNFMIKSPLKKDRHPLKVYINAFGDTPNSWICPGSFLATLGF